LALGCTRLDVEGKQVYEADGSGAARDIRFAGIGGQWQAERL
jgi:hypothetical protein